MGICLSYVIRTQEVEGCRPRLSALQCGSWYLYNSLCPSFKITSCLLQFLLPVHVKSRKKSGGSTDFSFSFIGQNCVIWSPHLEVRSWKRLFSLQSLECARQEKCLPWFLNIFFLMQSWNSVSEITLWKGINNRAPVTILNTGIICSSTSLKNYTIRTSKEKSFKRWKNWDSTEK